jgi:hypothetical protein
LTGTATTRSDLFISVKNAAVHGQVENLFGHGLDLSATYLVTQLTSSGSVRVTSGSANGRNLGGFTTSKTEDTLSGGVFLGAVRYRTPFEFLVGRKLGLGGELLFSTKDSVYFDQNPDDPSQFYATRGEAQHLYVLQPLNENLEVRIGMRRQLQLWTQPGLGETRGDGTKIETYYADFKVAW